MSRKHHKPPETSVRPRCCKKLQPPPIAAACSCSSSCSCCPSSSTATQPHASPQNNPLSPQPLHPSHPCLSGATPAPPHSTARSSPPPLPPSPPPFHCYDAHPAAVCPARCILRQQQRHHRSIRCDCCSKRLHAAQVRCPAPNIIAAVVNQAAPLLVQLHCRSENCNVLKDIACCLSAAGKACGCNTANSARGSAVRSLKQQAPVLAAYFM
jgi:hypothetical protein